MENIGIEQLAADRILDRGVRMKMRAPLFIRWLTLGRVKHLGLTVKSPYEGTMHRVAGYYLRTGITSETLENISHEAALGLMAVHGENITKAVACAWLNGYWAGKLLTRPLAWYMRWHCTPQEIATVAMMLLLYGGTSDFMITTRSVRMMKITAPRLGQTTKGS
jgi:hypothetical protein